MFAFKHHDNYYVDVTLNILLRCGFLTVSATPSLLHSSNSVLVSRIPFCGMFYVL